MALLIKGKALLFGLVKLKYLFSMLTAVISVFAYARGYGWAGAIGFVALFLFMKWGMCWSCVLKGFREVAPIYPVSGRNYWHEKISQGRR